MGYLSEIKKEIKEKGRNENHAKSNVTLMQTAFVKDHIGCERCGNIKNLTYDHIIPQMILKMFNIDPLREFWEENGQVYCYACNQIKGNNLDLSNPKTSVLLLELINKPTNIAVK